MTTPLIEYLNSTLRQQQLLSLEKYSTDRIEYIQNKLVPDIIRDVNPIGKIKYAIQLLDVYNEELKKMSDYTFHKTSDKAVGGDFLRLPHGKRLDYYKNREQFSQACDKMLISIYRCNGSSFAPIHYIVNTLLLFFKSFNLASRDVFTNRLCVIPEFKDVVNNVIYARLYMTMETVNKLYNEYDNAYMQECINKRKYKEMEEKINRTELQGLEPTRDLLMELKSISKNHQDFIDLVKLNYKCGRSTVYRWLKKFNIPSDRRTKTGDTNVTVNADTNVTVSEDMVPKSAYDAVLKKLQELEDKLQEKEQQSPVDGDTVSKDVYDEVVNERDYYIGENKKLLNENKYLKGANEKKEKMISDLQTTLSNKPIDMPSNDTNSMQPGPGVMTINTGFGNLSGLEGFTMPIMSIG